MKAITTNIPDEQIDLINSRCKELGINRSEYLRRLVFNDINIIKPKPKRQSSLLQKLKAEFGVTDEIAPKRTWKKGRDEIWEPAERYSVPYHIGEVYFDEIRTFSGKGALRPLSISLSELLMLHEFLSKHAHFTNGDLKRFKELLGISDYTIKRVCANLINGDFDGVVLNEISNDTNWDIFYNMLCKSLLSFDEVERICDMVANKGFSYSYVFNLQKMYSNYDSWFIRKICENYDNKLLHKLIKVQKETFVENNPSKRRNLIRNGGLI